MLQSLYAGVSGLINHQRSMDVIGNNISNVNTVGYKKSQAGFADIMSMNIGGSSVNPMQVGLGTRVNSTNLIFSQGGIEATNKATDLAISGRGFFVVSNGVMDYYSRNGNFIFNNAGKLVTPEGLVAQGRLATQDKYGDFFINQTGEIVDIQIPVGVKSPAKATTNVELGGNLNSVALGTILETPELRAMVDGTDDISQLYNQTGTHISLLNDQPVILKAHGTSITNIGQLYNSGDENLGIRDGDTFKITLTKDGASPAPLVLTYRAKSGDEYSINGIPRDLDPSDTNFSTLGGLADKIKSAFASDIAELTIVEGKLQMKASNPIASFSLDSNTVPSNSKFNNIMAGVEGSYATGDIKTSGELFFQSKYVKGDDFNSLAELTGRLESGMKNISQAAKVYLGDVGAFEFKDNNDRIRVSMNVAGTTVTQEYYYSTASNPEGRDASNEGGVDSFAKPFSTLDELIQAINSDFAPGNNTITMTDGDIIGAASSAIVNGKIATLAAPLVENTIITNTTAAEIILRDGKKDANNQYRTLTIPGTVPGPAGVVTILANGKVDVNGTEYDFTFPKGMQLPNGLQIDNQDTKFYYTAIGSTTGGTLDTVQHNLIRASNDGGRIRFENISGVELQDVQVVYSGVNIGNDKKVNELLDDLNGVYTADSDPKISDPLGGKIVYDNNNDGGFSLTAMGFADTRDSFSILLSNAPIAANNAPVMATFVYDPTNQLPEVTSDGSYTFSSLDELLAVIQEAQGTLVTAPAERIAYSITADGRIKATTAVAIDPSSDGSPETFFNINTIAPSLVPNSIGDGAVAPGNLPLTLNLTKRGESTPTTLNLNLNAIATFDMDGIAKYLEDEIVAQGVTGFKVEWTGKDFLFKNPSSGGLTKLEITFDDTNNFDNILNPLFAPVNSTIFSEGVHARTRQIGYEESPIVYSGTNITTRYLLNAAPSAPFNTANGLSFAGTGESGILRANFSHNITGAEIISSPSLEQALALANTINRGSVATSQTLLTIATADDKLANLYNSTGAWLGLQTNDKIAVSALVNDKKFESNMVVSNNLGYPSDTTLGDLVQALTTTLELKNPVGAYVSSNGSIIVNGDDGENYAILDMSLRAAGRDQFNSLSTFTIQQQASGGFHSTTIPIIDSEGHEHSVVIEFEKDSDPRNVNQWKWKATIPRPAQVTGGAGSTLLPSGVVTFTPDGGLGVVVGSPINIVPNNGANPLEIRLDFGTIGGGFDGFTQYASKSITTKQRQNGYKEGSLEDYVIDDRGVISGLFSNGQSRQLAQIVMADFTNPQGLQKVGGSLYAANDSSGKPTITEPGEGGLGFVVSSSLEMSNVDLSMEITQMITIERGFQANSKIITTSDAMIQELLAMKR
ncbi:flagellar hook-basal body complex protein [Chrysiogenes arsenatis]|uniref:flagellar hook-basal body complex protein n=1 Tax=Chrysiogenes arsenatis TaxID=309797 RepID=UPI000415499F|nr:flagellar hook-basal body complex protein [Chrysiogenes arsenatis]